jgi:hypothetical protein
MLSFTSSSSSSNHVRLKLNGTHQLLAYSVDVNLLGDNIDTIKKISEPLIEVRKEVGLEINIEKTKYILLSRLQHVGQNQEIETANRSLDFRWICLAQYTELWWSRVNTFMNVPYHKEADVFCTAIVTTISSGRFLDVKTTAL